MSADALARRAVAKARQDGMRDLAARLETYILGGDLESSVLRLVSRINATDERRPVSVERRL